MVTTSMRKRVLLGTLGMAGALATTTIATPAQAATNPYSPQAACHNDFGGTWSTTTDGHRDVTDGAGKKLGDVYLMYNNATGYNCVTTIKSAYVGTASETDAGLAVQGDTTYWDPASPPHPYKYYAAVEHYAAGRCVEYLGFIYSPDYSDLGTGGRFDKWGNCG